METTKPKFISKHKKLLASCFIVALALSAGIVYVRTEGVTVGSVNIRVDAPGPVTSSTFSIPTVVVAPVTLTENLSVTWQGNGTININQFAIWLNASIAPLSNCYPPNCQITSPLITPEILSLIGNQTTVSPTLVAVNILGYSNGNSVISIVFIGNFHLQESWGVINTKQVDFTYASYDN